MMGLKKTIKFKTTIVLVFVVIFITFSALYAMNDPSSTFVKRQRPPVNFLDNYHDIHIESQECLTCHHQYENNQNVLDEGELQDALEEGNPEFLCSSCHNSKSITDLQKAFHSQCIGCHDRLSDSGEKVGFSLCGECHIRKKVDSTG